MKVYMVTVVDGNGKVYVQREFSTQAECENYADILVEVISTVENREVKHVEEQILKEQPDLKDKLISAREIEDKYVVAEMVVKYG